MRLLTASSSDATRRSSRAVTSFGEGRQPFSKPRVAALQVAELALQLDAFQRERVEVGKIRCGGHRFPSSHTTWTMCRHYAAIAASGLQWPISPPAAVSTP